jgi:hypothetical protein
LLVMVLLSILMLLATATVIGALRVQRVATDGFHRAALRNALADQFRADVGRASAAPDEADGQKAGPHCLILRLGDGRLVSYRWHDQLLERLESEPHGQSVRPVPLAGERVGEFIREGAQRRLIILRFGESRTRESGRHLVEIAAVLGGDLQ